MEKILICPTCQISIEVAEVNCNKFVCGIYRDNGLQINPHLSEKECEKIVNEIYGCGSALTLHNGKLIKTCWG
jgi:hypothetical protein